MEEADQLSDRVAVIDHGKIIALAPPRELKETVMKSEVIEIEAQNIDPQIVEKLKGIANISEVVSSIEDASSLRGLIKVHSTDGKNAIPDMLGVLVKGGVEVSNLKIATPTLEDVFISLTGRALRD